MAKHCNVCDQDYADNLAACPRCAAAKKTQLASRSEARTTQLAKRDDERVTRLAGKEAEDVGELPAQPEATPTDSAVNLGGSEEELAEVESGVDLSEGEVVEAEESGFGVAKPEQPAPSASDVALRSLMEEPADAEPPAEEHVEEHAVSEKEVDDLLANLEEVPDEDTPQEAAERAEGEEAIAAAEAEEAAEAAEVEDAEVEDEKPAKPAKPRSSIPALAGATVLGILIGVGGTVGARALMGPGEKEKRPSLLSGPQGMSPGVPQAMAAPSFETQAARVASGDWDEAKAAGIEQVQGSTAKELAVRGQYHLFVYLKNADNKINADDPALLKALQDLQKAAEQNEPNAVYDLALIKELAGKLDEARGEYAKAAQKFANDPALKQLFETAVLRVEVKAAVKAVSTSLVPQRGGVEDCAALLALLSIALQQPPAPAPQQPAQQPPQPQQPGQPGQPPAAAENKEAGFEFWDAVKLAHGGKFAEAVSAIERARKLHDRMRFTRLRKAQNPLSDPAEDIFLRCCEELKMYWQLEKELRDGGYLTDKNTPAQALQALVEKSKGGGTQVKELTDKLTAAQQGQKEAETKAAELEKQIDKSKSENAKLAGDLKAIQKTIEDNKSDLASVKQQLEKLKGDSDTHSGSLKQIRAELVAANLLDANDKANVGDAVKKAIAVARSKDPQGLIRRQVEEIAQLSIALHERWQPQEMLPLWLLLLDEYRNETELADMAMKDAQRVLSDPQASVMDKTGAQVVLGLALRNTDKFSAAKTALEAARPRVTEISRFKPGERTLANYFPGALKEVSDPAAYFASQAQAWYDHGRMETALTVLERGMKAAPAKDQGRLLAQRSLIELDAARSKGRGPLPPTEPLLIAAQMDAGAAVKTGAAEGHYAAGRIAEALGQVDAAIASYRAALAAHARLDSEGGRYRMALARVLLLPRPSSSPPPAGANPPAPPPQAAPTLPSPKLGEGNNVPSPKLGEGNNVPSPKLGETMFPPPIWGGNNVPSPKLGEGRVGGWRDPAPYPAKYFEDRKSLVLMLTLGLQAPLLPGEEPGLDEAEKLADEVLKAPPGAVPFAVMAQALAVKGRWSLALQVYVEGLRPMLPREYYDGLVYLLVNDPRLKRPDSLRIPNPLEAERHFAAGLNFYFDGDYINAEKSFLLTIENDSQDARFFYFLGLSRLAQNRRRDAYADFNQGTLLERLNRPASGAVDESLERIQGPMRYTVNEFRQSPER